jgi:hypothetical protein
LTNAVDVWKQFHWSFFVHTQGLLIALGRFREAMNAGKISVARMELSSAAELLQASGAAMELAGSYSRKAYESQVRPSMLPPHVNSEDFSGLMSWDHAALMQLWRQLRPVFQNLPAALDAEHRVFIEAYGFLASSHRAVCQRFGGDENGSLRNEDQIAIDALDLFEKRRRNLIDPNQSSGCPFAHEMASKSP